MKLSISIKCIKKVVKYLKIGTSSIEIKGKEKDYTITDIKKIILFL